MDTTFTILAGIGGGGDFIQEKLPFWQQILPYLCFSYTLIALWIGAFSRMTPYQQGAGKFGWSLFILLLPFLGALYTIFAFRSAKYKHIPTLQERKDAQLKESQQQASEQAVRDQEARESFKPFS